MITMQATIYSEFPSPIRRALERAILPYRPCGLNADWSCRAWHLGWGKANHTTGELYLLDDEGTDGYTLVRRWYASEDSLDGNDDIAEVDHGSLESMLARAIEIRTGEVKEAMFWEVSG